MFCSDLFCPQLLNPCNDLSELMLRYVMPHLFPLVETKPLQTPQGILTRLSMPEGTVADTQVAHKDTATGIAIRCTPNLGITNRCARNLGITHRYARNL